MTWDAGQPRPTQTVAILFTDIEGSVRRWEKHGAGFEPVLQLHDRVVRGCIERHRGREVKTLGDGFLVAFERAGDAVRCAVQIQQALAVTEWPEGVDPVRVRGAVHAGEVLLSGDDLLGRPVNTAARILQAATGGMTLVSQTALDLAEPDLRAAVELIELGPHVLRDVVRPVRLLLALPSGAPPPASVFIRSADSLPTNLPVAVDEFVGRSREIARVEELLIRHGTRLVTLAGPGGVGKTRLLHRIGELCLDDFSDGVWLVELADIGSPAAVPEAIASALSISLPGDAADPTVPLAQALSRKDLLLLLDNFEHVIEAAPAIAQLLQGAAGLKCLVTSRERLQLRAEGVVQLAPLELPAASDPPEDQATADSFRLFCYRATAARGAPLDETETRWVAPICADLGGLPLGIELGAARLAHMTCAELHESLSNRPVQLKSASRDLAPRQRSIEATIEWSVGLLPPEEARTFYSVGVFRGGLFADAAVAVCERADAAEHLESLQDKSLLQSEAIGDRTRYSMLPLVRAYALERLEGELDTLTGRAARHLTEASEHLDLHGSPADLACAQAELDNVRTALGWAQEHEENGIILRLMRCYWPIFNLAGSATEGIAWLERAVHAARLERDELAAARLLIALAVGHKLARRLSEADVLVQQALEACAAGQHEDEACRLWALMERGCLLHMMGDTVHGEAVIHECLDAYTAIGSNWGQAECLRALGRMACEGARYDEARTHLRAALDLEDPRHQAWGVSNTLFELGNVGAAEGDPATALEHYQQSLRLSRDLEDQPGLIMRLLAVARTSRDLGERQAAATAAREALMRARRHAPGMADEAADMALSAQ